MIEGALLKGLQWAMSVSPIATAIVLLLGGVLILCELFVEATPKKDDDKKWAAVKSGYLGPFISVIISITKTFLTKFFKK